MFGDRQNGDRRNRYSRPELGRRVASGLFGAIVVLAFAGLALALAPLAQPMVQLAATEIEAIPESTGEDTTRETKPAEKPVEETTERAAEGAGTLRAANEAPANTAQNSPVNEPEEGARDPESSEGHAEGQSSGEADAGGAEPAKTSASATDGEGGNRSEVEDGAQDTLSTAADGKDAPKTEDTAKPQSNEQTNKQTDEQAKEQIEEQPKQQTEEQKEVEPPAKQEEPDPPAPANKTMSLSVPRLTQVQGDTVLNSDSPGTMAQAAMKLPSTGFPWQEGANTYIAGHRIGWKGTESRYQFYNLPAMRNGDAVYLTDANGTTYEYRVTEKFAVNPSENWVTEPVAGRDMITLQTCTDSVDPSTWWDITPKLMQAGPDTGRLVVRADKVATYPA